MLTYPVAFIVSLAVAAILTPLVARWAHRNGWFDLPTEARKIHTRPIPRLGGLAVAVAFFAPLAGLAIYTNRISFLLYADGRMFAAFCVGGVAILSLGVYDDFRGASAKLKLVVQALVAIGVWLAGFRIDLLGNPFGAPIELGMLSLPLTMLWMVGVVNALNLIDGLDGLAAGIALSAAVVLFGVAFVDNAVLLCLLTAALAGSLVGFLFFNFNPARIFLGDSGSMLLGFILATISIWTQRKGATAAALLIPVIALGVPILDTMLSFTRRVLRKQSPFKADREHMHHRLLALGLSHRNAVFTLYTVSAVFALAALALLDNDTTHRTIVLSTVAVVVFILVRKIGFLRDPAKARARVEASSARDLLRAVGRSVRQAPDVDEAWARLKPAFEKLPWEGVRLVLDQGSSPEERKEQIFHWRRAFDRAWSADQPLPAGALTVTLDEGGTRFGQLAVYGAKGEPAPELLVNLEIIREALIDHCVTRESRALDARVVHLTPPAGIPARSRA
jgi:UDP-GlcNAc:undecaprenyl-phosphate GlcNAc-1-phosphate transferase